MAYKIQQSEDKFEVIETGYKPLCLEKCDTKKEAEKAITKWQAYDDLSDDINDFVDQMLEKYQDRLTQEDIQSTIRQSGALLPL